MAPSAARSIIADAIKAAPPTAEAQAEAVLRALETAGLEIVATEDLTPEEEHAHYQGLDDVERGNFVRWEDLKAELKL